MLHLRIVMSRRASLVVRVSVSVSLAHCDESPRQLGGELLLAVGHYLEEWVAWKLLVTVLGNDGREQVHEPTTDAEQPCRRVEPAPWALE